MEFLWGWCFLNIHVKISPNVLCLDEALMGLKMYVSFLPYLKDFRWSPLIMQKSKRGIGPPTACPKAALGSGNAAYSGGLLLPCFSSGCCSSGWLLGQAF